jgi:hypothetical protein
MKLLLFLFTLASLVMLSSASAFGAAEIVLDDVTGIPAQAGNPVRFTFRLTYTPGDGSAVTGFTNGFCICEKRCGEPAFPVFMSPITYDTLAIGWDTIMDGGVFMNPFGIDGAGCDTICFGGYALFEPGFQDPFDEQVWWVEATPANNGDLLCIGSASFSPGCEWLWNTTGGPIEPDWDGCDDIICFPVGVPTSNGSIWLDEVTGLTPDGEIIAGEKATFIFRLINSTGHNIIGSTNGFRILTYWNGNPLSVLGLTVDGSFLDSCPDWPSMYDFGPFVSEFPIPSPPRVAFYGAAFATAPGIPPDFNEQVWKIDVTVPAHLTTEGLTLCIDSAFYPPGGNWLWALDDGSFVEPYWHDLDTCCFSAIPPPVTSFIADVKIEPGSMFFYYRYTITPWIGTLYLGDFTGGRLPGDVNASSVRINGTVVPTSVSIIPSHPEFDGEVLKIEFPIAEFLEGYGTFWDMSLNTYTVSGEFNDSDTFSIDGTVILIGHRSGDVNCDGKVNVADITYLVNYLFSGGPPPDIPQTADANGDCATNVADVTYLVNYLFNGGPAPVPCPQ